MRRSVSAVTPTSEPLTLSEAKKHLEIAVADDTHDTHIRALITAAREVWEHDTQTLTVSRTVTENWDDWPGTNWRLYYRPVSAISTITYYDTDNSSQTLSSSVYSLDAPNGQLMLAVDQDWPSIETRWDAITATYTAGQTVVDEIAKQAMKLQVDIGFEMRGIAPVKKDDCIKAYENLVKRYMRGSYP